MIQIEQTPNPDSLKFLSPNPETKIEFVFSSKLNFLIAKPKLLISLSLFIAAQVCKLISSCPINVEVDAENPEIDPSIFDCRLAPTKTR